MKVLNEKLVLAASIVAFALIVLIVFSSIYNVPEKSPIGRQVRGPQMVPNYLLWAAIIITAFFTVLVSYYVFSKRLEKKMDKNIKAITKLVDRKINSKTVSSPKKSNGDGKILKLVNSAERKIIEKLLQSNGSVMQSEISRIDGMGRLKAHRTLKGLEDKEVVELERYGKTNRVVLNKEIKEILCK